MSIAHIVGRIVKKSSQAPTIAIASVCSRDGKHTILQTSGHFATMVDKAKTYVFTASAPGYVDKQVKIAISAADIKRRRAKLVKISLTVAKKAAATKRGRRSKR